MEPPLRQHPYAGQSMSLQRRNSFSTTTTAEIEQSRSSSSESAELPSRSPRKSASFSSLSDSFRLDLGAGRPQSSFEPRLSPVHSPQLDRRDPSDLASDSDDDEDPAAKPNVEDDDNEDEGSDSDSGGAYSSAISDDDRVASPSSSVAPSPTKEPASLLSNEPLHKPPASDAVTFPTDVKPLELSVAAAATPSLTAVPDSRLAQGATDRIEQEIRHAIDSAAARVQEELGRREEFETELRAALTYEPPAGLASSRRNSLPLHEDPEFDDLVASLLHPSSFNASTAPQSQEATQERASDEDLLLLMEIVIGEGRCETIEVHAGDRPDALAASFSAKHSLQPEAVPTLSRHIQNQLDALAAAEKEADPVLSEAGGDVDSTASTCNSTPAAYYNGDGIARDPSYSHSDLQDAHHFSIHQHDPHGVVSPPPAPTSLESPDAGHQQHYQHVEYIEGHDLVEPVDGGMVDGPRHQSATHSDGWARENQREYNYNCLMAKYGHYSQHSGTVDPGAAAAIPKSKPDVLTMRNIELSERKRVVDSGHGATSIERERPGKASFVKGPSTMATTRPMPTMTTTAAVNGKKKKKSAPAPVFQRLFALAESKDKWLQRARRAKAAEGEREQEELQKHATTRAARYGIKDGSYYGGGGGGTVEFASNRTGGGNYAHAGERLYKEALADLAKKEKLREQRAAEREHQIDWMCPKCAFVNHHNDEWCKSMVSVAGPASASGSSTAKADAPARCNSMSSSHEPLTTKQQQQQQQTTEAACGQRKPSHLFRPTLMTAPAGVARAITRNKEKVAATSAEPSASSTSRRERSQKAMEEEFRRACPFKPTINVVSEEIVREKLESEARAAGLTASPVNSPREALAMEKADADTAELLRRRQRRDPHLALYEDAFQARANREAREREYMAQFPFKPDIGVNALWAPADESREAFVERLAVSKYREFERRREVLVDKYAPRDRDPNTGRELFKPEVGRAPAFNRNERKLPIGDFLYEAHREHREYLRRLQEQHEAEIRQRQSRGFVSEASRQALERRKKDTCTRIFDALRRLQSEGDSAADGSGGGEGDVHSLGSYVTTVDDTRKPHDDSSTRGESSPSHSEPGVVKTPDKEAQHGGDYENNDSDKPNDASSPAEQVVSPRRVDLAQLPAEIGRVVAIIFEFANYEELPRAAFAAHMDTLVREVPGLTYTQVLFLADLLDDGKSSRRRYDPLSAAASTQAQEDEELTFCPSIDKNSRAIATKHGRADRAKVFLALNQYFDHYKKKREQVEKQRRREFEKTHPFQPTLVTKRQERTRAAEGFYDKIAQLEEAYKRPPTPSGPALSTVISNARPSVRPIDSDDPPLVAAPRSSYQDSRHCVNETSACDEHNVDRNSSSSISHGTGEDEDAELTSRVLAALDEAHAADAGAGASASLAKLSALVREGAAQPSH